MNEPLVYLNGLFTPLPLARVSILDRGFCYGDGLFETMRSYKGIVHRLDSHLERLVRSARMIFLDLPVTQGELKSAIYETLKRNSCPEAIIRLTITRGEHSPGMQIDPDQPPTVVIHSRPFEPLPDKFYSEGVKISLFPSTASRTSGIRQQVKSCNYLSQILIRELASQNGSLEGIMMEEKNQITEGTTSNIFIVRDGNLRTPSINEYILEGTIRREVLDLAREHDISCFEETLTCDDVYNADEVFLTNTGIEILPVCQADDKTIGSGQPGSLTHFLHKEFLKTVEG